MSEIPAAARGTRKMKNRQAIIAASGNPGTGMGIIFCPLAGSGGSGLRTPVPKPPQPRRPGQTRRAKALTPEVQSLPGQAANPPITTRSPQASYRTPPAGAWECSPAFAVPAKISHSHRVRALRAVAIALASRSPRYFGGRVARRRLGARQNRGQVGFDTWIFSLDHDGPGEHVFRLRHSWGTRMSTELATLYTEIFAAAN